MMDLKPCPFCGGDAELVETNMWRDETEEYFLYYVICHNCEIWTAGWTNPEMAVERWNRRAE